MSTHLVCDRCHGVISPGENVEFIGVDVEQERIFTSDQALVRHAECPTAKAWLSFLLGEQWVGTLAFVSMADCSTFAAEMVQAGEQPPFEWDAVIPYLEGEKEPPADQQATHEARVAPDGWTIREL